ncbi:transcriptional regulator XRE family [Candidatus Termititenax persephonae]|uniref:Transcriptional regulator XRE family n=1 Tax=Candidatus Termititenax persephonae TaxID=2218525 RepID=A0A388TG08_9BACT|nr:transcriptional regulator XRE family [Candidatus Termititenax persephonae]
MTDNKDIRKVIGDKLRSVRVRLKYSLQHMADKYAIDYAHYYQIEKGNRYVRLDILQKISKHLGVGIDFWFRDDDIQFTRIQTASIMGVINSFDKNKRDFLCDMLTAYSKRRK